MKISGKYSLFLDGKKVAETTNLITSSGKVSILRYLAGISSTYAGSLAAGVDSTGPTTSDKELGFEVFQEKIDISSVDYVNSQVLFKSTFGVGDKMTIYEIGMFPDVQSTSRSYALTYFDSNEDWSGSYYSIYTGDDVRISDTGLKLELPESSGTVATISNDSQFNFSDMSLSDEFALAVIFYDDNCDYIKLILTDVNGNQMVGQFDIPEIGSEDGEYKIISLDRGSFTNLDKNWAKVIRVTLEVKDKSNAGTSVVFDGLRTVDNNIQEGSEVVSKTLLAAPVVKSADQTLDIQYSLSFPF